MITVKENSMFRYTLDENYGTITLWKDVDGTWEEVDDFESLRDAETRANNMLKEKSVRYTPMMALKQSSYEEMPINIKITSIKQGRFGVDVRYTQGKERECEDFSDDEYIRDTEENKKIFSEIVSLYKKIDLLRKKADYISLNELKQHFKEGER